MVNIIIVDVGRGEEETGARDYCRVLPPGAQRNSVQRKSARIVWNFFSAGIKLRNFVKSRGIPLNTEFRKVRIPPDFFSTGEASGAPATGTDHTWRLQRAEYTHETAGQEQSVIREGVIRTPSFFVHF